MIDLILSDPYNVPVFTAVGESARCLGTEMLFGQQVLLNSGKTGDICQLYNENNLDQPTIRIKLNYKNIPVQQFIYGTNTSTGEKVPSPKSLCVTTIGACPLPTMNNHFRPYRKISFETDSVTGEYKLDTLLVVLNYNSSYGNHRVVPDYFSVSSRGGTYVNGVFVENPRMQRVYDPKIGNQSDYPFEPFKRGFFSSLLKIKLFFLGIISIF